MLAERSTKPSNCWRAEPVMLLVRPEVAETKMTYVGVHAPFGPASAGPFTPAPADFVAVFADGREQPD